MKSLLTKLTLVLIAVTAMAMPVRAQQEQKPKDSGSKTASKKAPQSDKEQKHPGTSGKPHSCCVFSDIEMEDICGRKVKLSDYKGKVVLVVNVASKCGFTGQYRPLQSIYDELNEQGLEVAAFPCNQFGKQEPGNDEQISSFCKKRFGIAFDIFSKVDVKGKKQAELFRRLTSMPLEPAGKGDIKWNFEKFIIGKDGKPIARFRSDVHPNSEAIVNKIKQALATVDNKSDMKEDSARKQTGKKQNTDGASPVNKKGKHNSGKIKNDA